MDTESLKLVSVLTPSFDQAAYIGDTLRSVACQTYPRIEHVVMDGGSADGTVALLEAADPPVFWRSEPDRGQAHAVNKALAASSGSIIGWLNSDDAYFHCEVVERVVEYFDAHPEVDVVYGHAVRTAHDGRVVWIMWVPRFRKARFRRYNYIVNPAAFIRRSALSEPMLDESFEFAMDWELWMRLASQGRRFARIGDVFAVDRSQPGRKNKTIVDVLRKDEGRLAEMYGFARPWYHSVIDRHFVLRQRLMGSFLVGRVVSARLAFAGYIDSRAALWKRQVASRKSRWSDEDRVAS